MADALRMVHLVQHRRYHEAERHDVFIWDIDKTYLETRFSSWRGLLRIPFEWAIDKVAARGAVELLRAIREGPDPQKPRLAPLYFVSGSPKQLQGVIERKMLLDGIQADGLALKDQWGLVRSLRPTTILEQVGYKTMALMLLRTQLPTSVRFYCFGDDVESDSTVFALWGDILAGLRGTQLRSRLRSHGVGWPEVEAIMRLAELRAPEENPVQRAWIRRVTGKAVSPRDGFEVIDDYGVAAQALAHSGHIGAHAMEAVMSSVRGVRPSPSVR
jgi:hypothetical protein